MELMTVIVIIGILSLMVMGVSSTIKFRAEKVLCITNLKNLYAGAAAYVQQNQTWPQIQSGASKAEKEAYAKGWIESLRPFGLVEKNWLCPSVARILRDRELLDNDDEVRIDYMATPFDERPNTPYLWPTQPWFIERGAVHQGGNLMIRTNGQIVSLQEAILFGNPL
jgi:type II secretory pathway pseudopilin PulG